MTNRGKKWTIQRKVGKLGYKGCGLAQQGFTTWHKR